jgi:hypothetical protein
MKILLSVLTMLLFAMNGFAQQKDSIAQPVVERVDFCNDQVKEEEIKGLIKPSFPGGQDSMMAFLRCAIPDSVQKMCGEVYLYLTVDTLGNIDILRMSVARDSVCGKQIVSAFYGMPRWNPALYVNEAGESKKQSWNAHVKGVF